MRLVRLLAALGAIAMLALIAGSSAAEAPPVGPVSQTAVGTVTRAGPGVILVQSKSDGTRSYCEVWGGALKTTDGQTINWYIETPMTGSLPAGIYAVDKTAVTRNNKLLQAWFLRPSATVTITYEPATVDACGRSVNNVVTGVVMTLHPGRTHTVTGQVSVLYSRKTLRDEGAVCAVWNGSLDKRAGQPLNFAVEGAVTGGHSDPRAVRTAQTLARAARLGVKGVTSVTYRGPVLACGQVLPEVVVAASIRRRAGGAHS